MSNVEGMNEQLNAAKAGFVEANHNLVAATEGAQTIENRLIAIGMLVNKALGLVPSEPMVDNVIHPMMAAQGKLTESASALHEAAEGTYNQRLTEAEKESERARRFAVEGGSVGPVMTPEDLRGGVREIEERLGELRGLIIKVTGRGYVTLKGALAAASRNTEHAVENISGYQADNDLPQ